MRNILNLLLIVLVAIFLGIAFGNISLNKGESGKNNFLAYAACKTLGENCNPGCCAGLICDGDNKCALAPTSTPTPTPTLAPTSTPTPTPEPVCRELDQNCNAQTNVFCCTGLTCVDGDNKATSLEGSCKNLPSPTPTVTPTPEPVCRELDQNCNAQTNVLCCTGLTCVDGDNKATSLEGSCKNLPSPTPTQTPSNPQSGQGDGLSDGRSDGLSSCPECTKPPKTTVLGASTDPQVLGLSTTSGDGYITYMEALITLLSGVYGIKLITKRS